MSESVDRETTIRDLIDHVEYNTDAARHCIVEIEPGAFVVTRTRAQAVHLRGALAVLRAQLPKAEMLGAPANALPPSAATVALDSEPVTDETDETPESEPAAPAKRGPGRPRKAAATGN
jgi:hypothetical protein